MATKPTDLQHKTPTKSITIRLPETLIYNLKIQANRLAISYKSLIKIYLDTRIQQEFQLI